MTSIDLQSDMVLFALLKEGDGSAFRAIYERYYPLLYVHACKMLKTPEEADDTIQEVFTNLWQKAAEIEVTVSLSAYLYAATRNRVINLIAHKKVRSEYLSSMQRFVAGDMCQTEHEVRERELTKLIEKEIAALPEKMRFIFELSRKGAFSHKEIAEKLKISEKTVKKQVQNALKTLRRRLSSPQSLMMLFFIH